MGKLIGALLVALLVMPATSRALKRRPYAERYDIERWSEVDGDGRVQVSRPVQGWLIFRNDGVLAGSGSYRLSVGAIESGIFGHVRPGMPYTRRANVADVDRLFMTSRRNYPSVAYPDGDAIRIEWKSTPEGRTVVLEGRARRRTKW